MKFKLDENLPSLSRAILTGVGHDVDTVAQKTGRARRTGRLSPLLPQLGEF